ERRVVVIETAARRAGPEREHPLRVGHLLVNALERGRLALADRADDPEQVGLSRREARGLGAESRHVEGRARHRHELHRTARRDEWVLEERILLGPVEERVEPCRRVANLAAFEHANRRAGGLAVSSSAAAHLSHSRAPFRQTYTSATTSKR